MQGFHLPLGPSRSIAPTLLLLLDLSSTKEVEKEARQGEKEIKEGVKLREGRRRELLPRRFDKRLVICKEETFLLSSL